jgi:hypothetical protein
MLYERWTEVIPLILLKIQSAVKEDKQETPFEIVFDTITRSLNEFFLRQKSQPTHFRI